MSIAEVAGQACPLFTIRLPVSPYPGLRPFEPDEWPIFFGRERMADEVVARLLAQHVLVLHGDSGCGKSSLVRAAVLPKLEQQNARGGVCWRTCIALPGEQPLWNIARALAGVEAPLPDPARTTAFRRALNLGRDAPAAVAELLRGGPASAQHVCMLIDQFEELFEHARLHGPEQARLLTDLLAALHDEPPQGLYAALTMRSEFIGACGRYAGFAELVNAAQYLLPRMDRDDLQRAIREPATLYGGEVSCELATRLIADTGTSQDQLPLIQHGLMLMHRRLVRARPEAAAVPLPVVAAEAGARPAVAWRLGLEDYPAEGGLAGLLSSHADALMDQAQASYPPAPESARVVEELFKALTEINAKGHVLRHPRRLRQLLAMTGSDETRLRGIIDLYRADGDSLLRPYGREPLAPDERIDISHEALIRCWHRLGGDTKDGWLYREFRNGMAWRSLLVQAESYEADPKNVLGPAATDDRLEWISRRNADWAERYGGGWERVERLLAASVAERDRLREEQAEAQRREQAARLRGQRLMFSYMLGAVLLLITAIAVWQSDVAHQKSLVSQQQFEALMALRERDERLRGAAQESVQTLQRIEALQQGGAQPSDTAVENLRKQLEEQISGIAGSAPRVAAAGAAGPRVYIHIVDESQRRGAGALEQSLERLALGSVRVVVPSIVLVKASPSQSVLRCFRTEECEQDGRRLVMEANRLLLTTKLELQDLSARYGESAQIRPRHYEIWFAAGPVEVRRD